MFIPNVGMPKISAEKIAGPERRVSADGYLEMVPAGRVIDGSKTRDTGSDSLSSIRAGLLMGIVTASGKYANSFFGTTTGALAGTGTSFTIAVAEAVELVRRNGGVTGTITITGPSVASGTARTMTATISAVDQTTGVVTLTALGVNQVEQINLNIASTAGNLQLNVAKTDGTFVTTGNAAWSATDATYINNINAALDTATGVTGGIVASAIPSVDTDLGIRLTYSGTGYAGLAWSPAEVALFPTSSTAAIYTPITAAASGAFVAGSLIGDDDGSQVPVTFIPDGWGEYLPTDGGDLPFSYLPIKGVLDGSQLLPWPADAGLKQYIRDQLNVRGSFRFVERY